MRRALRLTAETREEMSAARLLGWLPLFALVLLFGWHLSQVASHAVDLPFADEWPVMREGLGSEVTFEWLTARRNMHRLVPTRLQIWALYRLDGWNLVTHQILNFFLFGLIPLTFLFLATRAAPAFAPSGMGCFLLFSLSPLCFVNHAIGLQSVFHFVILFTLASAICLFSNQQRWVHLAAGVVFAWLAIYSLAAGVVTSLVLLAVFTLFKLQRAAEAGSDRRRAELTGWSAVVGATVIGIALWFIGYGQVVPREPPLWPHSLEFWHFWLNMISAGFGFHTISSALGALCLAVILLPVAAEVVESRGRLTPHDDVRHGDPAGASGRRRRYRYRPRAARVWSMSRLVAMSKLP